MHHTGSQEEVQVVVQEDRRSETVDAFIIILTYLILYPYPVRFRIE
jgi:hypothetical protein